MQKYIAVVNPKMEEDEIENLIRKGIAGAIFEISHQNYPLAAKLIGLVKELARKNNKPVSIIQDVSGMQDPLDLHFGHRLGANWFASDNEEHLKMAKGLNKLAGLIYKGRNLPKAIRVDSVMEKGFVDPDATIENKSHIKHIIVDHPKQAVMDSLLELSSHAGSSGIAVSDLGLAAALSQRRPARKIIFASKNPSLTERSAIYWGVQPVYLGNNLTSSIRDAGILKAGERIADATDPRHVTIHLI